MNTSESTPFFADVEAASRVRDGMIDVHTSPRAGEGRKPAVVFVHGGPVSEDQQPTPRDWEGFVGYGALAAASGLVGITFNHRLYSDSHYPQAAEDLAATIEQTRALDSVDPDRIGLWFFSGGGVLAAEWLVKRPEWLRCVAFTYPVLAPPPGWPGDGPRFDVLAAASSAPSLPKLLLRVGGELPFFAQTQDAFVEAERAHDGDLEVIELPEAQHGFEGHGYVEQPRAAVDTAMGWVASTLHG
ncbi:alpha/beta hydrolase [Parasphingorhabdus pacifica]